MSKTLFFISFFFICTNTREVVAQSILVPEEVHKKCRDLPFKEKARLAVARFSQTTGRGYRGSSISTGNLENFSTMLSNAMFEIDCFRMLSMIQDKGYTYHGKREEAIQPHFIITGEITEYYHEQEEKKLLFKKETIVTAHVGFVLQIKDPVSREILFSKSFNKDGINKSGGIDISIKGNDLRRKSNASVDQAYFDAFEKCILDAVTYIVDQKRRIYDMVDIVTMDEEVVGEVIEIIIDRANFKRVLELEKILKASVKVLEVNKNLQSGRGRLSVTIGGTIDDVVDVMMSSTLSEHIEITGYEGSSLFIVIGS